MGKAIKSMTLEQAKAYQQELRSQGRTESTSKEAGKLADYIATLEPEKYGEERLSEAYSKLSRGVTTTGGWTEQNLDLIERYTGTRPQLTDPNQDISGYLSDYQDMVYGNASSVELRESIAAQLEPDMERPEPFSRVEQLETMREEYGLTELEQQLNDLKASVREQYALRTQRIQAAEGKPVALGVIAGRVTEIERQEAERIDVLNREIAYITDQVNTAYNVIDKYINYMGLDYQDAVTAYNEAFNRNLQIYNLTVEAIDRQQAAARANLQLYMNAITSGNMDYGSLSSSERLQVNKLELSSGLPMGFVSRLRMNPKDTLLMTNGETGQAAFMDANGNIRVVNTGIGTGGRTGTATDTRFQAAVQQGREDLARGYNWGEVFERISSQFPEVSDATLNAQLGGSWNPETGETTGWAMGGAWEAFQAKTTQQGGDTLAQDLQDAKRAIDSGQFDPNAVRRRFLETHPDKASLFDSYMTGK